MIIGGIPGVIAGALLGGFAALLKSASPWLRIVALTAAAISVVAVLAAVFRMEEFVPIAGVPTFIAVLLLERWTRRSLPPPPIPVATVVTDTAALDPSRATGTT